MLTIRSDARAKKFSNSVRSIRTRADVVDASDGLIRTSEAGFAGGELGILELLDAYRGAIEDDMTAIDLDLAARRARIELDVVTGGYNE